MVGVIWPKVIRMATIFRDVAGISGHAELNSEEFNPLACGRHKINILVR